MWRVSLRDGAIAPVVRLILKDRIVPAAWHRHIGPPRTGLPAVQQNYRDPRKPRMKAEHRHALYMILSIRLINQSGAACDIPAQTRLFS